MRGARSLVSCLALFLLGGCAVAAGSCPYKNDAAAEIERSSTILPAGCKVTDLMRAAVRLITCADGRQGFVGAEAP